MEMDDLSIQQAPVQCSKESGLGLEDSLSELLSELPTNNDEDIHDLSFSSFSEGAQEDLATKPITTAIFDVHHDNLMTPTSLVSMTTASFRRGNNGMFGTTNVATSKKASGKNRLSEDLATTYKIKSSIQRDVRAAMSA